MSHRTAPLAWQKTSGLRLTVRFLELRLNFLFFLRILVHIKGRPCDACVGGSK